MKIFLLILACCCLNNLIGQNTKHLLFDLPVEQGDSAVKTTLITDTSNFRQKETYRSKNNQTVSIPIFYARSFPEIISLQPENMSFTIESEMCKTDSTFAPALIIALNYFEKSKRKKVKVFYQKLINYLKVDYASADKDNIVGLVFSNGKKWNNYETMTYFYTKPGAPCVKLSVIWNDEGKHGQTIFLIYRFE